MLKPIPQPRAALYMDPTPLGIPYPPPEQPQPGLYTQEAAYWDKLFDKTPQQYAYARGIFETMRIGLEAAAAGARETRSFIQGKRVTDAELVNNATYVTKLAAGTTILGISRLTREMLRLAAEHNYQMPAIRADRAPRICLDINASDGERGGLHISPYLLKRLGIQRPQPDGAYNWYEANTLYIRATYPAQPSDDLRKSYRKNYGIALPEHHFVSLVPRLKWHFLDRNPNDPFGLNRSQ